MKSTAFASFVVLISSTALLAQDANVLTEKQREMAISHIRSRVSFEFKKAFSDDDRKTIVDKAKDEPWIHTSNFIEAKANTYGKLPDGLRDAAPIAITPKGRGVVSYGRDADIGKGGRVVRGGTSSYFCLDKLTDNQKLVVGEKNKWTDDRHVFFVTGQVDVDKKKVWRVVMVEFTDKEKARFDPRVK